MFAGTRAQNGHFYPTVRTEIEQSSDRPTPSQKHAASLAPKYWKGWGGVSDEFDQLDITASFYAELAGRDGYLSQGLELDQPFDWSKEWAQAPCEPWRDPLKLRRRGPTPSQVRQEEWEREELARQREKQRISDEEWNAQLERENEAERERTELEGAKAERVTRQEVEHNLGMSIAEAKARFIPCPTLLGGYVDLTQFVSGVHAHPSLWLWDDEDDPAAG